MGREKCIIMQTCRDATDGIRADVSPFFIMAWLIEACPVNKSLVKSLQFAINSCFSKIFQIKDSSLILECVTVFNCSVLGASKRRQMKFRNTFCMSVRPNEFMFRERAN